MTDYNPRVKRTFGEVFRRDIEMAKSGYTAPGGRSDGSIPGVDLDMELRHDIPALPVVRKTCHHSPGYPTTRMGRIIKTIKLDIERSRP